ncbi:sensor histidine kinase [Massilioclostridium coli]|uniref:sensor histidine kinase n=1 Tax=Massilioclostridium coli TaxID=1870991 RepID=UPI0022E1682D|nr:sensor histidine kinase [Massilioclostridium coli]
MKLLLQYFNYHKKSIVVFISFGVIFAVVFFLYRLPVSAVGYGVAVCAFVGMIAMILDFQRFYRKHHQLKKVCEQINVTKEHLPSTKQLLEQDYQEIIYTLYQQRQELSDQMNNKYTDLVEYYTIWAHQIKTPIASMRLNLQSQDTDLSRELSDDLIRIEQYVEMVLCYLRLDSSSTDYVIREYDLDQMVKQAVRKFATQFIRKKITLRYNVLGCNVLTDEKWLLFVIEQLLSNALKYTKSGGQITIELEQPKILCIRDTGIGIAPEDLPRVFEKGYTGYNGRSDKKASGIGLYLCRRICENLGHRIELSSDLDSGTVVRIHLNSANLEVE